MTEGGSGIVIIILRGFNEWILCVFVWRKIKHSEHTLDWLVGLCVATYYLCTYINVLLTLIARPIQEDNVERTLSKD